MDRGAGWATMHRVAQSQTRLSTWSWKPPLPHTPLPSIPSNLTLQEIMRDYIQKHPELNISEEGITKSTLTKAERQLKDKFDGRPTKPPP